MRVVGTRIIYKRLINLCFHYDIWIMSDMTIDFEVFDTTGYEMSAPVECQTLWRNPPISCSLVANTSTCSLWNENIQILYGIFRRPAITTHVSCKQCQYIWPG